MKWFPGMSTGCLLFIICSFLLFGLLYIAAKEILLTAVGVGAQARSTGYISAGKPAVAHTGLVSRGRLGSVQQYEFETTSGVTVRSSRGIGGDTAAQEFEVRYWSWFPVVNAATIDLSSLHTRYVKSWAILLTVLLAGASAGAFIWHRFPRW